MKQLVRLAVFLGFTASTFGGQDAFQDLPQLGSGKTRAVNALWIENPLTAQFKTSKRVVVAELKGPAMITMMHFAYGQSQISSAHKRLNRDLLLRIYWDAEATPSVECPLVDFFCDPAGLRNEVNTALVNVRRGFNAYFPMPFRRSARVELVYDGPLEPGEELWKLMPCYSYVMYRTGKTPTRTGYFHAAWRQDAVLLGQHDYLALEAKGHGKVIGWNVSVRLPGRANYPVDENEKFFIDGESTASVEFQGLEDSFGFSWGFPESESEFPLTGYYSFFQGAFAYRFFLQDAIEFKKSVRVAIGFGVNEGEEWFRNYSRRGNSLQFSSTVYWYQTEPHATLPRMPSAAERAPAPEQPFWPDHEALPTVEELKARHVKLQLRCGKPEREIFFAQPGYTAVFRRGRAWNGWGLPVCHARADEQEVQIELAVPPSRKGKLRIYVIDPDNFGGGRRESIMVGGESLGKVDHFQEGRWLELPLSGEKTSTGTIVIRARNENKSANAVISLVEWEEKPE